jgi:hypothetical protein
VVLAGILAPLAAVALLSRLRSAEVRGWVLAAAILVQGVGFARWIDGFRSSWYEPACQRDELRAVADWIRSELPEDAAIAADFVNGPALLLATRRPILVQPKYDTVESRRRARDFLETFFHGSPEDLRRLLVERYQCRHLLVDRYTLWNVSRYAGGIPWSVREPRPGTAAAAFVTQDADALARVPGFELLYRSPSRIRQSNGEPCDLFRLYRLADFGAEER